MQGRRRRDFGCTVEEPPKISFDPDADRLSCLKYDCPLYPQESCFVPFWDRQPDIEPVLSQKSISTVSPLMFGPNITGEIDGKNGFLFSWWKGSMSGAFSCETANPMTSTGEGGAVSVTKISFSSHDSQSMYGVSSTVQPAALRVFPCIKS